MPKTAAIPRRVPSTADLKVVRNAVVEAADTFRRATPNLDAVRERARAEAERSADELARFASDFDRREMVKAHVAKATKAFQDERADKFGHAHKEIAGIRDIVEHGRGLYTSKRSLLDMLTLGDPIRAVYAQNLASAGPVALTRAASYALVTRNAALAAAVAAAVVDRMPAKERPIAVAELVRDLEHPEIDGPMALFAELDALVVGAETAASAVLSPDNRPARAHPARAGAAPGRPAPAGRGHRPGPPGREREQDQPRARRPQGRSPARRGRGRRGRDLNVQARQDGCGLGIGAEAEQRQEG